MIPRGKLDISYSEIFRGLYYCTRDIIPPHRQIENPLNNDTQLICLSVRTGFNLLLTFLDFPPGSEIIVSNISIPDMFAIIEAHQLVAVPVSIGKHTLNTSLKEIEDSISVNAKAILITHLFGGVAEMNDIIAIAQKNNLLVFEDGAQAFAGSDYKGHPKSDVVMQSFGLIKTNTAATGAVLFFNNIHLAQGVTRLNQQLPQQSTTVYFNKLVKAGFIRLFTTKWIYSILCYLIEKSGKDIDKVLSGFTRGFPGGDVMSKIKFKAGNPLIRLLSYKIAHYSLLNLEKRKQFAKAIMLNINPDVLIGEKNTGHSYWVMPIESKEPDNLILKLRKYGFDATAKASSLVELAIKNKATPGVLKLDHLVYLPMYPSMSNKNREKLISLVNSF